VLLTKTPRSIFQFPMVADATLAAALAVWPPKRNRSKNSVVGALCLICLRMPRRPPKGGIALTERS